LLGDCGSRDLHHRMIGLVVKRKTAENVESKRRHLIWDLSRKQGVVHGSEEGQNIKTL